MIINYPTYADFKKIALDCLHQAYNLIYDIDQQIDFASSDDATFITISDDEFDANYPATWNHNQQILRTSIILIHQSLESFMKAEIARVSPLLLLEGKRADWPTLPSQKNKDFNTFYTIGAEALLYTYNAVLTHTANEQLIQLIENVRLRRNKIVHSVTDELISPKEILSLILNTFTFFLGKDSWWYSLREQVFTNPFFGKIDSKYETARLTERLNDIERYFGRKELSNHFTQNLKSRSYYCPSCESGLNREDESLSSKWAFLYPNSASSKTIKCVCCFDENKVERTNCLQDACKGNVLFNGRCLTCFQG